ncbi:MAG: TniQ family protein [Rhizobiaceae bacterium]|nr:TniQ family protein [Rhizobiaceae bacterium]
MTLLARVELMPDELAQVSYVSRLAAVCGCPTAAKFCQEVGLDWTSIRKGKPEALAPLAEVSGADLDRLTRNSIVEVGPRSYELRGCHAISNMFRTAEYALCPVCVADDLASGSGANAYDRVHLRIAWHLRAIETCHVHDRKLITCPLKSIRNERRDFATFGWDAAYQWASKPPEAVVQRPTPFELYLIARLDGKAGSTWLDEMPMSEVTRVCEFFGSAIATGEFRRRRHLENDAIRAIRDVGFRSLKSGPEALQDVLTAKLASLGDTSRFVSISNIIGPMAELLVDRENQTTDFWHFRHEVQKFVESNLPDQVLRVSLPSSAGPFRLRDIAERTRLSQDALARAAHRLGLEQTSDEQFETLPARRIVREARNLWTNRQVRSMLGVTNEILWVLADSSLLGKVHRSQVHKANRRFEPAAIEAFAEKLRALPSSERTESDNWVSIVNAALRARCGVDVVVGMLLNGTIRKVLRDRDENGLASIRVCGLEVFSARFGVPWSGLSMRQTAKNLGATFEVVSALIAQGALVHCRARAGATDAVFVSEESLRDFKHRYVSLAELAKLSGGSAIKLNKELAEKGIAPAISREQCGASYFRRDDIRL